MSFHYHDYTDPENGHRVRIVVTGSGLSQLTGYGSQPPWKYYGIFGAGWLPFPSDSIEVPQVGDVAFNGNLSIGAPKAPTAKVRFDLVRMDNNEFGFTFSSFLLDPVTLGGVSYAIPGGSSHTMTTDTTNLLTIYTDNGNAALATSDFAVVFQGAQVKQALRPLELSFLNDTAFYEATFEHVVTACLGRVKPIDIAQYALYNLNTTTYVGGAGDYAFDHFYDAIYTDGSVIYATAASTRGGTQADRFRGRLFAVEALPRTVELLAQEVYRGLVRNQNAAFEFRKLVGGTSLDDASIQGEATPFDYLRFATQNYGTNGERGGSSLQVNPPGSKELFFIGAGWRDVGVTYAVGTDDLGLALDSGDVTFGMFAPGDTQAGVYKYSNAYDLFVDMCEGGLSKATYLFEEGVGTGADLNCNVYFSPVLGGVRAITGIRRSDTINEDPAAVLGAGYVRTVEAQWPDPFGEDEGIIERAPTEGNLGDPKGGVNLFFHNMPYQGSEDDFKFWDSNFTGYPSFQVADSLYHSYPYFSPRRLYYIDDAGTLLNSDAPILAHNQVQYEKNWSTFTAWLGTVRTWSNPGLFTGFHPFASRVDHYKESFIRPYRARLLALQRESCLPYAASDTLQAMFGSQDQWGITVRAESSLANITYIGERFQLKNESDSNAALDIFVQNGSFLDATNYPSLSYCTAATEEDGFVKLSLLGIAAT